MKKRRRRSVLKEEEGDGSPYVDAMVMMMCRDDDGIPYQLPVSNTCWASCSSERLHDMVFSSSLYSCLSKSACWVREGCTFSGNCTTGHTCISTRVASEAVHAEEAGCIITAGYDHRPVQGPL